MVTLAGEGFKSGVTGCRFGSSPVVMADVASSVEATCVSPAGVAGQVVLELNTASTTTALFEMVDNAQVSSVVPSVVSAAGGEEIMLVSSSESRVVACMFDQRVVVTAEVSGDGSGMACRAVALAAGNTTVHVSVNGQEWSSEGAELVLASGMNVSAVDPEIVSVMGGSEVMLRGTGLGGQSELWCGVGGLSWSPSKARVVSDSEAHCVLPARGDGMRVVEVSMSAGGEMSSSGVQVEYMGASQVSSVWPASGAVSGGTMVTLAGEGFKSGVTGCR